MEISIGFSTCPNDTFIFDALVHKKIDTQGITFLPTLADVEELNNKAFTHELQVTKLSYHAFAYLTDSYILSNSGSALGFGVGPLLVSKMGTSFDINNATVAIPGKFTTANFLFSVAYPNFIGKKTALIFSEIEEAVLSGRVDAGLLIHEGRFTYKDKGMQLIQDLGSFWEKEVNQPIPLGGIVISRSLDKKLQLSIDSLIRKSIVFAFDNPESSAEYVKHHAQELSADIVKKHIDLYVNKQSLFLDVEGKNAVKKMLDLAIDKKVISEYNSNLFIE